MNIFYHPKKGRCGDFIPFYYKGEYHLFYIHGEPWEHISTTDFVNFKEYPTAIPSGGENAQDKSIYTGSVIEKDGIVYVIYTGHNPVFKQNSGHEQVVMLAKSTDCVNFEKQPAFSLPPCGDEFIEDQWRDPFVYFNEEEQCYHMILTAAHDRGLFRRWGVTQLFKSKDFENWEKCAPVYAPYTYDTHECPDIFKIGENWYLIFSTYSKTWETRYRIAKSPYGPWKVPQNDTLGGKAFYAAKTVTNGKDRYLVGWTALKEGLKDKEAYHWGGCLTVHQVGVSDDGILTLSIVDNIKNAFDTEVKKEYNLITGDAKIEGEKIAFENPKQFSLVKIGEVKDNFLASFKVKNNNRSKSFANNFGLIFFGNGEKIENWYQISVEANGDKVYLERTSQWLFDSIFSNEELICELDEEFEITVVMENTCGVLYVNNRNAISFRCYDFKEGMIGFSAQDTAEIEISDIKVSTY